VAIKQAYLLSTYANYMIISWTKQPQTNQHLSYLGYLNGYANKTADQLYVWLLLGIFKSLMAKLGGYLSSKQLQLLSGMVHIHCYNVKFLFTIHSAYGFCS
jgi:hypothetical protein